MASFVLLYDFLYEQGAEVLEKSDSGAKEREDSEKAGTAE